MDRFIFLCLELCLVGNFPSARDCIELSDGVLTTLTVVRVSQRVKDAVERTFTKVTMSERRHDDVDRSALVVGRSANTGRSATFAHVRSAFGLIFHNLAEHALKCVS